MIWELDGTLKVMELSRPITRCVMLTGLILAVMAAAACQMSGGNPAPVTQQELENQAIDSLTEEVGQRPDTVRCNGGIDAKVGATQRCILTAGGGKVGLTATVTSVGGGKVDIDFQVDDTPIQE